MSDVMNGIFGRPKNEDPVGEYAYGTASPEPAVTEEVAPEATAETASEANVVAEEPDSVLEAGITAETAVDSADSAADDTVEDDAAEAAETSDEDVTGTDEEAVAVDSEEDAPEPVAEAVSVEPVAESEPVAARPAAGTRGSTTIADGVVTKIVVRIAGQADGVYSLDESGVKVELADEVAWITIPVVLEFGHAVKALGEQLRVAVIEAVEQYLGLDVEVVDVHVTDIHFPEED
ncbi:Asp23/Gls24 family envelope stress response protein [Amycolatopsis sp. NPDC026612]|uniref:Asp23/Gls24 family envelope stress response protein n=1 Tax=Amycolatopsis sp. NPDC026612 TaxID=3155466 RepID=UPI0033F7397E